MIMQKFIAIITVLFLQTVITNLAIAENIGEDGLHKQDWFTITFRDIAEDIKSASQENKRLVLIFEQRGCIYCKELHENVLSDKKVSQYLQEHFMVVQYNIYGDEEVIDLDGEMLTEKSISRKWGLLFTPTIMFMPEKPIKGKNAKQAAIATMPGAFKKGTFLDLFTWVNEKRYESDEGFQTYHARRIIERKNN